MFCENCGAQMEPGMKFCGVCGASAADKSAAPAPETAAVSAPQETKTASATEVLMNEYHRAAEGQTPAGAAANIAMGAPQPAPQPDRYTAQPAPVQTVKPVKKKSKKLIPICAAAGGVVAAAGAGLIIYNCNKASMTHAAMGDAGYAHAVVMETVKKTEGSALVSRVVDSTGGLVNAFTSMRNGSGSSALDSAGDMIGSAASGNVAGIANSLASSSGQDMAGMTVEYVTSIINEALGTNGLSATVTLSAELDEDLLDDIKDMADDAGVDEELVDSLVENLKELKFYAAEKDSGDALEYAAQVSLGKDSIVEAQLRYEKDGTATLVFPGISDKGISFELPEHTWEDMKKDAPETYDFDKLYSAIEEQTKKVFEDFDYEYENGSQTVNGVEFNGMTMSVKLGMDEICDLTSAVMEAILDESDFIDYLSELTETDADEIVESIEYSLKNIEEMKGQESFDGFSINIQMYMNNDNTLAGIQVKVKDKNNESGNAEVVYISNGKDAAASVSAGGFEYFTFKAEGKSASEGTAKFTVRQPGYSEDQKYTIKVDYKNFGTMNVFGTPCLKGDFEISVDSVTANAMSGGNSSAAEIIEDAKLLLSLAPNGKGAKVTVGAEVKDYGKFAVSFASDEPSGSVAPKPGSNYSLTDIEDLDDDFAEDLLDDFMEHIEKLGEKNKLISALLELEDEMGMGGQVSAMGGYVDDSSITAANSGAAQIKNQVDTFLTNMDANRKGYSGSQNTVMAVVSDGEWTFSYDGTSGNWYDGENHWGSTSGTGDDYYELTSNLRDCFRDIDDAFIVIYIRKGRVVGSVFVTGDYDSVYDIPDFNDFDNGTWDYCGSSKAGKVGSAYVGTAPCLALGY